MGSVTTPRIIGELVGTAMLVFFGVGALVASGQPYIAAVAMLLAVTAAYWIFGGHFNPWVTLATAIRGTTSWGAAGTLIVAQLAGGVIGAVFIWSVFGAEGVTNKLGVTRIANDAVNGKGLFGALLAETLAVFLLACIVLAVGETERLGIAMGVAYAVGILTISLVTAASMNLARTFGTDVALVLANLTDGVQPDLTGFARIWIYAVSGVLGASLAAMIYPLTRPAPPDEASEQE